MEDRYRSVGIYSIRQLLGNPASTYFACRCIFPGLDFFRIFICEADLLVEISLDELESFPAGLEENFVKFRDCSARAQRLKQIPLSDRYHINN